MHLPPESLHREAEPLGSGSPLSWGPAGSPPRREPAGAVVIPARAAAPAHKASAQGRALVFERSQNRARAEPPLRLRGAWSPTAVPGGHRGPLGGSLENGDVPGLLTRSPMPCHHLLRPSPGGPTVSLCRGSVEPAGGDRDPQPPCAPGAPGQKSPRGAVGKGSSGARLRACCAPAPTSVAALPAQDAAPATARPARAPGWRCRAGPCEPGVQGHILHWEKHPDPPQTPAGRRKKGTKHSWSWAARQPPVSSQLGAPTPGTRGFARSPPPDTTTQRHHAARIAAFSLKTHVQALAVQIFTAVYKCTKPKPNALEPGGVQLCKGPRAPPRAPYKNKGRLCLGGSALHGALAPPSAVGPSPTLPAHPPTRAAAPRAKIPFSEPISHSGGCQWLKQGGERGCAPPRAGPSPRPQPVQDPGALPAPPLQGCFVSIWRAQINPRPPRARRGHARSWR